MNRTTTPCPHCNRHNDAHTSTTDPASVPSDGDVSICWACHRVSAYSETPDGLTLRPLTADEQAEVDADPHIRAAIAAMAESYTPLQAADLLRGGR